MGVASFIKSKYLAEVQTLNDRIVSYPVAWAGFNLISNGAAAAQAWMAAYADIVAAGVIPNPCWLEGISLGLPQVAAFQADIRLARGAAGVEVLLAELPCGCNVWPPAEWNFPILWLPMPMQITGSPRLSFNIRNSVGVGVHGFAVCHVLVSTGVGA